MNQDETIHGGVNLFQKHEYVSNQIAWKLFKLEDKTVFQQIYIHTISIFSRKSPRLFVAINLTGMPFKLSDISASSRLFTTSEVPKIVRRVALSGANFSVVFGNELLLASFSRCDILWLYEVRDGLDAVGLK